MSCTERDSTLISNHQKTDCVPNPDLAAFNVVSVLFGDGVAWAGTCVVAAMFVCVAAIMTHLRSKRPGELMSHSRLNALYFSFLPGFSFGSSVFLFVTVLQVSPLLAGVMSIVRGMHLLGGATAVISIFGNRSYARSIDTLASCGRADIATGEDSGVEDRGFRGLRTHMDEDFTHAYLYLVETLALFMFCDVTMTRFLPWADTKFAGVSEGYPSMTLMNMCTVIKITETAVSVGVDIIYLSFFSESTDATLDQRRQTNALFILNLVFGTVTILVDVLIMCIRGGVLSSLEQSRGKGQGQGQGQGQGSYTQSSSTRAGASRGSVTMELGDIYSDGIARAGDAIPELSEPETMTSNPLHAAAAERTIKGLQEELQARDEENTALRETVQRLSTGARAPSEFSI
jgi:hypothetical protein